MSSPTAPVGLILIAHGSPDPDWAKPLRRIVERVKSLEPGRPVALALLTEPPSLRTAIEALCGQGCVRIELVAALLSAGGRHLKQDIPQWVNEARAEFPDLHLELRPGAIGEDEAIVDALARIALSPSKP